MVMIMTDNSKINRSLNIVCHNCYQCIMRGSERKKVSKLNIPQRFARKRQQPWALKSPTESMSHLVR